MPAFDTPFAHGFLRVAACAPRVRPADPHANAAATIAALEAAADRHADVLLCPELGLTGYAIDDLHMQDALLIGAEGAIETVRRATIGKRQLLIVGAPLRDVRGDALYNCAIALHGGEILGVVPKTYLPNYREFYEKRQFAAGDRSGATHVRIGDRDYLLADWQFVADDRPAARIGIEICEDLWAPIPPSTYSALTGATVILNLSASNVTIGKADMRNRLCAAQSERSLCAYVYAASGLGESTTDLAWDGQLAAFELGANIGQSPRFHEGDALLVVDIDVERITLERLRTPTFRDARERTPHLAPPQIATFQRNAPMHIAQPLLRPQDRFPFVPNDAARLDQECFEAYNIQVQGLRARLESTAIPKAVIGVSGGLDSTHALLVAARAFDAMNRPRDHIIAVTMPGFATSHTTRDNAWRLMRALGVDGREVDIKPLCRQMLKDLNHPAADGAPVYDVTFENVQAGLRTDYLFRLANQENGLVVGTGDLSELALGWCTYGVGDHMSHYGVNAGAPKTLIQHLIRWVAANAQHGEAVAHTLHAILETEISPELIPPGPDGKPQSTQAVIGPYALHDYFLFHITRYGLTPTKIAYLAWCAWRDQAAGDWPANLRAQDRTAYDIDAIAHWMEVFVQRFFQSSQYKRSALPNGPKIVSGGSLSPRGDWRAPSDSSAAPWRADVARLRAWIKG
jgi:NAD+ synthase (glutamine-hydrolysing)